MNNGANHNSNTAVAAVSVAGAGANANDTSASRTDSSRGEPAARAEPIRHLYVHIPFCARICPYCAFYKDLLDRSQTWRFCEALLRDLDQRCASFALSPETIYLGGGTPTALSTPQ